MTRTNAEREARRGTSDPTYLVYALGKRMLLELRVVSYGYPPIPILRRLMLGEQRAP